jgi:hypothetical protein
MGFFDRFRRKPHPSDTWTASQHLPLILDLTRPSICSATLGQPIEWLSVLGPPEDPGEVHQGRYCYFSKGLEVDADDGLVSGIVVVWLNEGQEEFQPFNGSVVYRDQRVDLGPGYREESFVGIMGDPYHRDEDEHEVILFYEKGPHVEWQVEFTLDGTLKALIITSEPLMGDRKQRAAYGVTKDWPPTYD